MSSIKSTTVGDFAPPDKVGGADDPLMDDVHRKPIRRESGISRYIPVLRRPPALLLDVRTGTKDMAFSALIDTHVTRYRQRGANDVAYYIADFIIRRLPEIEERGIGSDAERGLENLTETVRMFEHIHIAQSVDGG